MRYTKEQKQEAPIHVEPQLLNCRGVDYEVSVYEPEVLAAPEIDSLVEELTPITGRGFMQDQITEGLRQDVRHHIETSDRIVVARREGVARAFIAATMVPFEEGLIYHLEGIIVNPELQGTGLASGLVGSDLRSTGADLLAFHTQNGRMVSLGNKLAYINPADSERYGHLIQTKSQQGTVDKGRYGGSTLYGDAQKFSDIAVKNIDWQKGDAVICIGPVREIFIR